MIKWFLRIFGMVLVPKDAIAIVNKKFVLMGKNKALPGGSVIALNGEAGIQADTLAPGVYFGYWPWQYAITLQPFIQIPQGKIGIIEARDGNPLSDGRVLAKAIDSDAFQNARKFLTNGGERGRLPIALKLFYFVSICIAAVAMAWFGAELVTGLVSGLGSMRVSEALIGTVGFTGLALEVLLGLRADITDLRRRR